MSAYMYLGNNVGLIYAFHLDYVSGPGNDYAHNAQEVRRSITLPKTEEAIKVNPTRHMIAVTSDLYQHHSHAILKAHGFRVVVRFQSSHANPKEVLTLWTKRDPAVAKPAVEPAIGNFPPNCSVGWNAPDFRHLMMRGTKPTEAGWKKILLTPVWFKVAEGKVVKEALP